MRMIPSFLLLFVVDGRVIIHCDKYMHLGFARYIYQLRVVLLHSEANLRSPFHSSDLAKASTTLQLNNGGIVVTGGSKIFFVDKIQCSSRSTSQICKVEDNNQLLLTMKSKDTKKKKKECGKACIYINSSWSCSNPPQLGLGTDMDQIGGAGGQQD